MTSRTVRPAAQATGLPPNVLKNSMPLAKAAAIASVVTTAASGNPLPMGLPRTTMSGTTPDPLDDRPEKTVLLLEAAFVFRKETIEIMEKHSVEDKAYAVPPPSTASTAPVT